MYGSNDYKNSITVQRLKNFYGKHFLYLFHPWNFFTRSNHVTSINTPTLIGSTVYAGNIFNRLKPPAKLSVASESSSDSSTSSGAGYN